MLVYQRVYCNHIGFMDVDDDLMIFSSRTLHRFNLACSPDDGFDIDSPPLMLSQTTIDEQNIYNMFDIGYGS